MPGPPPIPTAVLHKRGSRLADGRGREPQPETIARTEIDSPAGLVPPIPLGDRALAIWCELVPIVHRMGVLTRADVHSFARYCIAFGDWLKYQQLVDEHGATIEIEGAPPVDPAETAPIEELGLADSLLAKLAPTNSRTVRDVEDRLAAGHLAELKGIGKAAIASIERSVATWRAAHPVKRPLGTSQQRAEFWTLNRLEEKLLKYERQFGLNPADRVRLHISDEQLAAASLTNQQRKNKVAATAHDLIKGNRN